MTVIEFQQVSKQFIIQRDRRASFHERITELFRKRLEANVFWALRDVSFSIGRGETVGLIGHNGSGKSTTLKLVSRILNPTSGHIGVTGRVSALLELGSGFHPDLSGRENIYLNGSLLGFSRAEIERAADAIIDFSEIGDFINMPVKHYSSGMYMRLGFAIAVSINPDILITDEVLAVGDEAFQRKCLDHIYRLKQEGRTILFVSHTMAQVANLCSRVLWFDHGVLKADGEPGPVIEAYLESMNRQERDRLAHERGEQPEQASPDQQGRLGTHEAEFVKVEILDGEQQPRTIFTTGERLILRMHYLAHQPIEQPVFGIAIYHQNGMHINGPNTRFAGVPIERIEGEGYLDYCIPSLPLLEGKYRFTVALTDHSLSHFYDYYDRKFSFKIQPANIAESFGLFDFPAIWDWQPGRPAPQGQPAGEPGHE